MALMHNRKQNNLLVNHQIIQISLCNYYYMHMWIDWEWFYVIIHEHRYCCCPLSMLVLAGCQLAINCSSRGIPCMLWYMHISKWNGVVFTMFCSHMDMINCTPIKGNIIVTLHFVECNINFIAQWKIIFVQYHFVECNKNDLVQSKMWYLFYCIPEKCENVKHLRKNWKNWKC